MGAETENGIGGRVDRLERDVGDLRVDFQGVKATLGGFSSILNEIKSGLSNARPAWWTVAPIALTLVFMIAGGVMVVGELKGDIARFQELKDVRDRQLTAIGARLDLIESRQYDEVRRERDELRGKLR